MDDRVTDLDTLRDVALEKGISIQSKTMKVKDYLTYAICDDGEVVRVPKWRSKGTVKAATAGTKLGEDYCTEAVVALIERNQAELAQQRALAFDLNEEDLFFDASGLSDMTENNLAGKGEDNGTGIPHEEGVDDAGDYTADDTSRRREDTDGNGEVEQGWPGTIENIAEGNSGVCWEYAHRLRKFQEVRQRVDQQRQEQSRRHEAGVRKAHDVYGKSLRFDREFTDGFGASLDGGLGVRGEDPGFHGENGRERQRHRSEHQRRNHETAQRAGDAHRDQSQADEAQRCERVRDQRNNSRSGRGSSERELELDFL